MSRASHNFAKMCPQPTWIVTLASASELNQFLGSIERRAYKHALFAVRDEQAALDIVQDSMMKLAEKYGEQPIAELPLVFQRILQNTIHDYYRRQKVRNTWVSLFSSLGSKYEEDDFDPLDNLEDADNASTPQTPSDSLQQKQTMAAIDQAMKKLPARQREAFLLRYWEGLDEKDTALVMGCSNGSVKTHCSRATHALSKLLQAKGIKL